jgi:very-short-patch-repair endonuclease
MINYASLMQSYFENPHALLLSALCAGAVLIAALAYIILRSRRAPLYQRTPLLTVNETEFYGRLREALPWACILPQTAMSALVQPRANLSESVRRQAFWQIAQKRIDFVVCSNDLQVLCVVELDDRSHDKAKDARRDQILSDAGIQTLRYESRRNLRPSPSEISHDVHHLLREHPPQPIKRANYEN